MIRLYSKLLVIVILNVMVGYTQAQTSDVFTVNDLPENVSIHQLDNGLQVLLIENPALPMVGVNVVIKTGSAYENFATSGMSHMLEHLLFNGTTIRTQKELYDQVDQIGGYNNANTGEYFTNFMMVTPAEFIKQGMELQADMLFNSTLPEDKFEKEKGIVLEEIAKSLAKPEEQFDRNVRSILYTGHALSMPTLGTYSTIEHMNRDEVKAFYKKNYVPNNMIMSVVGRFDRQKMMDDINNIYGKAAPDQVGKDSNQGLATGFESIRAGDLVIPRVVHRTYSGEEKHLQLFYKLPFSAHVQYYDLLDMAIENKINNLEKSVKVQFPDKIKSVKMNIYQKPVLAQLEVDVTLTADISYEELVPFINENMTVLNFQLSKEELSAEISKRRTAFLKNIEKPHMFGIYNAQAFAEGGIERVLSSYGDTGYKHAAVELGQLKLTPAEIIIIQHPQTDVDDAQAKSIIETKLFKGNDNRPDLIIRQNPSSPLLAIHYIIKHKAPLEAQYGKDAAKLLHECIGIRLNSAQMKKLSSKYGLTYVVNDNPYIPMDNIYLHPDFGYIRVEGLAEYSREIIEFLNEQLLDFQPTEAELEKAKGKSGRSGPMMGMGNKAKKIFDNHLRTSIYEVNPHKSSQPVASIEDLRAFSTKYFNPSNMIVAVVGPQSIENLSGMFEVFRSDTESTNDNEVYQEIFKQPAENIRIEEKGDGEQAYLYWGFIKPIEEEDKAALQALSLALADRIIFDVREKQGMAYRMKSGIDMRSDKAAFFVNMGTRPSNVDVLLPQIPEFFDKKYIKDLSEQELRKSINMYLGRMMFRRLSSINQGYYLSHSLYFYDDIEYDQKFLDKLKAVNVEQVKAVADKYLKAENTVQIVVR